MGYSHYYETKKVPDKKWKALIKDVKSLLKDAKDIAFEYNIDVPPFINHNCIRFNGIGEDGHETFVLEPNNDNFCKTNHKPYDKYVTAVLLLARIHLGNNISVRSDGDVNEWQEAVQLINNHPDIHLIVRLLENPDSEQPNRFNNSILDWSNKVKSKSIFNNTEDTEDTEVVIAKEVKPIPDTPINGLLSQFVIS